MLILINYEINVLLVC